MTRGENSDIQHRSTASTTSSSPLTLVMVAFMPANEASRPSSPVAEDRTATTALDPRAR